MGASIGVDSHKGSLAAAAVDELGRVLGVREFPNDPGGHRALLAWATKPTPPSTAPVPCASPKTPENKFETSGSW